MITWYYLRHWCKLLIHLLPEGNLLYPEPHPLPEIEHVVAMLLVLCHVKERLQGRDTKVCGNALKQGLLHCNTDY